MATTRIPTNPTYWPSTTRHAGTPRAKNNASSTMSSTFVTANRPIARMMSSTSEP
jgi:hypothetical protein